MVKMTPYKSTIDIKLILMCFFLCTYSKSSGWVSNKGGLISVQVLCLFKPYDSLAVL